ncbi:MAG: VWA domain-containing protein [Bacteroidales bacterium]|nr:VWA domain-containing protein [Bacteroidales bacterium]
MELTRTEKMEAISKDFLDRDQDTYVKIRRTGRLGWESLIPAGGSYSDMLRDCRGEGDVVKEAYGMARDYIVAMDTPYKVILRLSPEVSCTDSKVVYLSTRVFDDGDLSEGQKIDTFMGFAIHEGCHLKWTDFTQMGSVDNDIVRNLINLLEDERIERLCGQEMPGYANYLKATKYYMFDLYLQRKAKEGKGGTLPAPVRLLNAILSIIRYPKALGREDLEEFADYLYDVREIIKDYPSSADEVTAAAKAVYEVIRKFFEDEQKKESDGGQSGEGETGGEKKSQAQGDKKSQDGCDEKSQPGCDNKSQEECDEKSQTGCDKKSPANAEGENRDQENEALRKAVESALSSLEREMGDMSELTSVPGESEPLSEEDMAECVKRDSNQLAGICENMITLGETSSSVLYRAEEAREPYDESLRRVRKYIPAISKTLKGHCSEYVVTYRGMRSGILDTGKLAEAYQGVQTVYQREGRVRSDRMAVCVLIDESGSMYGEKIRAARDLAVLLSEAVSAVPAIDLYIYGHTYGDRCRDSYCEGRKIAELQVYREKGYTPKKALGGVDARSGNLDSVAIREAAARMRKFSSCRKNLMFVITDGAPNERYEQLTDTVKELERTGMNIVAVCIEPSYDPSALYTHHVRFTDMNRLAIDLGKMIKKAIMKNACRVQE